MKKLCDVTFLIPIRLDSIIRLENLIMTVEHILNSFECKIHILEASGYNNGIIEGYFVRKPVKYTFIEDKDPVFHRTKYLNYMASKVDTRILALWDSDIIITEAQIINAVSQIRKGNAYFALPYDGNFLDTSEILRAYYFKNRDIDILIKNRNKMNLTYGDQARGGAIFAEVSKYIDAGMENEDFYGWGPEDMERYARWKGLGLNIYRSEGDLYHLSHLRGINSSYRSDEVAKNLRIKFLNAELSSKEELEQSIKFGSRK